jgi:metallo-beta-lactamase family protein
MESTYGDRYHEEGTDHVSDLARILEETFERGGNVVIPAFAVGRTQELLYFMRQIKQNNLVKNFPNFPVYVDSPLAIEATNVFKDNLLECYDEETKALVENGINPIAFPNLKMTVSSDESMAINIDKSPKVIISASGMCDAGRIRHHLKHNLWRSECSVVFAGYQAFGTLGRTLQDNVSEVRLFGENISVNAHIETLKSISSHADKNGLIKWVTAFEEKPKVVFIVHGDDKVCENFSNELKSKYGINSSAPFSGSVFDLIRGEWIKQTKGVAVVVKEVKEPESSVYLRLLGAGERLLKIIKENKHGANKDLAKFADQINDLAKKWEI